MVVAMLATLWFFAAMHFGTGSSASCFAMGLGCGYLSVFATTVAELFGTNLRVLATATVTNFMRGSVTLLIPLQLWLELRFGMSTTLALLITGAGVWALAVWSAMALPETFGRDLAFVE